MSVALGRQLRAAREARQLDIDECGHALRLPTRILRKLEAGDYTGISERVYLRNYLQSYGSCVGMTDNTLQEAIAELAPTVKAPELVSTGGVSRSHYLWQRYTTAATYVVLTAVIVVPLVWLGFNGGLDRELPHMEPLNATPVASQAVSTSNATAARTPSGVEDAAAARRSAEKPLMASLAPFSALDSINDEVSRAPIAPPVVDSASASAGHTLSITLSKPSWVEVTTADGERLQYSLLPAGTHKVYHSTQALHVSIGDTTGATVQLDGKPVRLDAYRHDNVAHFRIALKDGHAIPQSM
ncbi:MAG TPA: RodZ domain-containing protein [Oleiagrimonas sp.]|nr:RodZ domain-containing protein [Oleiagrimonas sp.]